MVAQDNVNQHVCHVLALHPVSEIWGAYYGELLLSNPHEWNLNLTHFIRDLLQSHHVDCTHNDVHMADDMNNCHLFSGEL
jgi:hypothetical protein